MASQRQLRAGGATVEIFLSDRLVGIGLKRIRREITGLRGDLRDLTHIGARSAAVLSSSFTRVGSIFARLGASVQLLGTVLTGAFGVPVKLAAELESATAEFTALTQSAARARQIISEFEEFSKVSIVPIEALHTAARTMLGYGVEASKVVEITKSLTAVSRGNSERLGRLALAFGQVAAKGKLMAVEVRQFVEAGLNPLKQISETTGRSMAELEEAMGQGTLTADDVAQAFKDATSEGGRFGTLLDELGKTTPGLFRRLSASVKLAIRPIGQQLLPVIRETLKSFLELLPNFKDFIAENGKMIASFALLSAALVPLGAAVTAIGISFVIIGLGINAVIGILSALLPLAAALGGGFGIFTAAVSATDGGLERFVSRIGEDFKRVGTVAKDSLEGILNALQSGNFELAWSITVLSLELAWAEGTSHMLDTWLDFKTGFLQITTDLVFEAKKLFVNLVAGLKTLFPLVFELAADAKAGAAKFGALFGRDLAIASSQSPEERKAIRAQFDAQLRAIEAQRDRDQLPAGESIEEERKSAIERINDDQRVAAETLRRNNAREVSDKQKELEALREAHRRAIGLAFRNEYEERGEDAADDAAKGAAALREFSTRIITSSAGFRSLLGLSKKNIDEQILAEEKKIVAAVELIAGREQLRFA